LEDEMAYDARWVFGKLAGPNEFLVRQVGYAAVTNAGRFVKLSNGEELPVDEPTFIFRARDILALPRLREYRDALSAVGGKDYAIKAVDEAIKVFEVFSIEHNNRMKQPGITEGR